MTDEEKERIRQATDIVALVGETVELRRRGRDYWGCCPFHHEKTASFHVDPALGIFKCFGCGKGGDIFGYVMERDKLEFYEAAQYLADRAGIELTDTREQRGPKTERARLFECLSDTADYYHRVLTRSREEGAAKARSYLSSRGYGIEVCKRWQIGYAPSGSQLASYLSNKGYTQAEMEAADVARVGGSYNRMLDRFFDRVMLPITNESGRVIGFGGRVMSDAQPKYLNTRETKLFHKSKNLYALDRAKERIVATSRVYVVEGYFDVIAMHEAGLSNVVAALGTAFTSDHVRTLSRWAKEIVCLFDGDAAGQAAAEKAVKFVIETEATMYAVVLPDGHDPDEYLRDHTAEQLQTYLDSTAQPLLDYVFEKKLAEADLSNPGRKLAVLDEMARLLAPLKNSLILDAYAVRLADRLGLDANSVRKKIQEAPIVHEEDRYQYRASTSKQAYTSSATVPRDDMPPDYAETTAYDYVPSEAAGSVSAVPQTPASDGSAASLIDQSFLTSDERTQAQTERELLACMASDPGMFRGQEERIGSLKWTDERHEAIAWAIMATSADAEGKTVLGSAVAVCPQAAEILASARLVGSYEGQQQQLAAFLLDSVDYYSVKRRIREIHSQLSSSNASNAAELMAEGTALQRREGELRVALDADRAALTAS